MRGNRGFILALLAASPLLFAVVALLLGKEAGWDLQNYHWYNPYALLNGRLGIDVAVAHAATFYNPLADLAAYWLGTHAPAWVVGAFLGALFGLAVGLIAVIAYAASPYLEEGWRRGAAVLLGIAGAVGGGALPSVGNSTNDVTAAVGALAALCLLTVRFDLLRSRDASHSRAWILLAAGALTGLSVGLKLTTAVYALGLFAAVLVIAPSLKQRVSFAALFAVGGLAGVAVSGGFWFWRMWNYGGNPFLPYFNDLFHSPLLSVSDYRDTTFIPESSWEKLLFPWLFARNSLRVSEVQFRDLHVLAMYVLIPVALAVICLRRTKAPQTPRTDLTMFLFAFAVVSYLVWLFMFSIYRYLIPLEMLAPVLIALAILHWPIGVRIRTIVAICVLVLLQVFVKYSIERQPWTRDYVAVRAPPLPDPAHSMVLMSGRQPTAFVIPSFPESVAFLRIDGWLIPAEDRSSGLAKTMRLRVATHEGPLYMMYVGYEEPRALVAATAYGLRLTSRCQAVESNLTGALKLCALERATVPPPGA